MSIYINHKNNWYIPKAKIVEELVDDSDEAVPVELNEYIFDRISERIVQKFKGHNMEELIEELIEEILKDKGFTIFRSPEGSDIGVD